MVVVAAAVVVVVVLAAAAVVAAVAVMWLQRCVGVGGGSNCGLGGRSGWSGVGIIIFVTIVAAAVAAQ